MESVEKSEKTENVEKTERISKPSLTRLARKAGIKSLSDECFPLLNRIIDDRIENILKICHVLMEQRDGRIILERDCYEAVSILGEEMGRSDHLGTRVVPTVKGGKSK